jgi:uncharacterized protein YrrD
MAMELKAMMNRRVISVASGREMGQVNRLLFEPESYTLYGFGIRPKHKNDPELVLLRGDIKAIGADVITIDRDEKVRPLLEDAHAQELVSMGKGLRGKPIVTEDGNELGKMSTLVLGEDGAIKALHASNWPMGFGQGRDIDPGNVLISGEDVIIVSSRENLPQQQDQQQPMRRDLPPSTDQRMAA